MYETKFERQKEMKITCFSRPGRLDDLENNLALMEEAIIEVSREGSDLLVFGEAFLQGFEAMSFRYREDVKKTLFVRSPEITRIRYRAREAHLGLAFGFYENEGGALYSSYLLIGKDGGIAGHYRRVSKGWKEAWACPDYREGKDFTIFDFEGWKLCPLVCGDFWEDELLSRIIDKDTELDLFLWPVHCDYKIEDWLEKECRAYRDRTRILSRPVLFVNNYIEEEGRAKGGVYLWQQGRTLDALPYGEAGMKEMVLTRDCG